MEEKIIPTDKARQGHWGRHVLLILLGGLFLAIIAWGIVEVYGELIEPPNVTTSAALSAPIGNVTLEAGLSG
jgi:hypothetical protein